MCVGDIYAVEIDESSSRCIYEEYISLFYSSRFSIGRKEMSTSAQQRQQFLRHLAQKCPETLPTLKNYLSSSAQVMAPAYKKTRDPLAMKELTSKCPSCSHAYTAQSFHYRGKVSANRRLHALLSIHRKYRRLPAPNTYKRRLFDHFTSRSRSKVWVKCPNCDERRTFDGATRKELPNQIVVPKPKIVSNQQKLKQTFERASCRFLKKESNLRAFLEQL